MANRNFENIYGAGIVAYNAAVALNEIEGPAKRRFFVSSAKDCKGFCGIEAECLAANNTNSVDKILIATPSQYHVEIEENLIQQGISNDNIVKLDPMMEYKLIGEYFKRNYGFKLISDFAVNDCDTYNRPEDKVSVFMAKHIKDRALKSTYELPKWVTPVQAGAAKTENRIANISDDFSGGISARNGNYSELTVTYWAWKNCPSEYIGICHYRRVYGITDEELRTLVDAGVELILTLPYMCKESATEQYFRYVSQEDYAVFCECLERTYGKSDSWNEIKKALNNQYVYNYNMLIARRDIFDKYCEFVFPVLFEMEQHFMNLGIDRDDRYLGYFGEILSSIFFIVNSRKYKTVHVPRVWLA